MSLSTGRDDRMTIGRKLWQVRWLFVLLLAATVGVGTALLYSAANASFEPWAMRHTVRFGVCLVIMLVVAVVDIRFWLRWAYAIYFGALLLLGAVEFAGSIGMGAQRWISLGVINLQPSELMKIAMVLALARYFHGLDVSEVGRPLQLLPPLLMVGAPAALVLRQPDLGTALMLLLAGGGLFFVAGVQLWKFAAVAWVSGAKVAEAEVSAMLVEA